jgi:lipid biosynthesis B12-binding/radical SAM protein
MKRILLVSSNITTEPFPVYPLGLAILASALTGRGHIVDQFDFLVAGESDETLRERVRSFVPDYVCLSVRNLDNCDSLATQAYPAIAKRLVDVIRGCCAVPIIIGGSAFSIMPEEFLDFAGADYGVVGEGERLLCDLIQELSAGKTPSRLLRNTGLIPGSEMISPLYSRELTGFYMESSGMINIQSKRGCPQKCIYCSYPDLEGDTLRFRDPAAVVDDMERARTDFGIDSFFFTDAIFNDREGHYLLVAEEIIKRGKPYRWTCYIRPQGLRRKEVALLKRAGLYATELGTDAACDRTLRALGKDLTFEEVLEVNNAFVAERVPCAHFVMFGGPGETRETAAEGLANLEKLKHTVVFAFTGIRILPNTPLHTLAVREGIIAADASMREPVFYHSPLIDRDLLYSMISDSFGARRNRIFPPEISQAKRDILLRYGFRGLLWDTIIRFPKDRVMASPED